MYICTCICTCTECIHIHVIMKFMMEPYFSGSEWNVNITLHSSLPIPWMTAPTSNQVIIQFNIDPKNALLKSIGQGKELNILNSSDTQKPHLKTSIASIPIRVTSPCLKQQV